MRRWECKGKGLGGGTGSSGFRKLSAKPQVETAQCPFQRKANGGVGDLLPSMTSNVPVGSPSCFTPTVQQCAGGWDAIRDGGLMDVLLVGTGKRLW